MKKFTSLLVVAAMLAAMMITMIPAASAAWDGSSVSAALIGSGTEFDPYLISSENDLAYVQKQVNDGITHFSGEYFKLTVDLDLGNNDWHPIGELQANYFGGNFDGDGHTITGLKVTTIIDSKAVYGGVFGRGVDCTIKNLTVDGAFVNSAKYTGAIIGAAYCTAGTGGSAIINCHAVNTVVNGLHCGGVVGRTSQSGATKGQIKITGCSAVNVTLNHSSVDDYPTVSNANHYVGGIVGAVGATIVSGCFVENLTINVYGTGSPLAGGIIGIQGADSVSTDMNNCYALGVTINVNADCSATNGSYGGLIGKAMHVSVTYGDSNKEVNFHNCFAANITINDPTESINKGVLIGRVNDTMYFNDIYYVAQSDMPSFGYDKFFAEWPFAEVAAVSDLKAENLNKGNSTVVWTDDVVLGHPVIDIDAVIANEPTFVDYYVEHADDTSEEITTDAPDVSTEKPDDTDEPTAEPTVEPDEPTNAPEGDVTTNAPGGENQGNTEEKKGCGGMIAGSAIVVALLGTAVVFKKRK